MRYSKLTSEFSHNSSMLKHMSFEQDFSLEHDFSRRHLCLNPPALAGGCLRFFLIF